jgi:hypothetical protein
MAEMRWSGALGVNACDMGQAELEAAKLPHISALGAKDDLQ